MMMSVVQQSMRKDIFFLMYANNKTCSSQGKLPNLKEIILKLPSDSMENS